MTVLEVDVFSKKNRTDKENKTTLPAIPITIYPNNIMDRIQQLSVDIFFYVDDPNGYLIDTFEYYDITYKRKNLIKSDTEVAILKVNYMTFVFREKTNLLPLVRSTEDTIFIEIPFLENLLNDPRNQKFLLALFNSHGLLRH